MSTQCTAKHTRYQPPDEEYRCKCGATPDTRDAQFYVDVTDEGAAESCPLLHNLDVLVCTRCDTETTGRAFANKLQKAKNLVTCTHCKGKGLIPGATT